MKCTICRLEFAKKTKSGTCSRACNAILQNKKKAESFVPNNCRECGNVIKIRQSSRVFCGTDCQHKWWRGENHYKWKGGHKRHIEGYLYSLVKEHPFRDRFGYILTHRYVMEDYLKTHEPQSIFLIDLDGEKYLKRECVVHHKNGIKHDNRISNLQVLESQSIHMKLDNPQHKDR